MQFFLVSGIFKNPFLLPTTHKHTKECFTQRIFFQNFILAITAVRSSISQGISLSVSSFIDKCNGGSIVLSHIKSIPSTISDK